MSRQEILPNPNVMTKYMTFPFSQDTHDEASTDQLNWLHERATGPDVRISKQFIRVDKKSTIRDPRTYDRSTNNRREVMGEARAVYGVRGQHLNGITSSHDTRFSR